MSPRSRPSALYWLLALLVLAVGVHVRTTRRALGRGAVWGDYFDLCRRLHEDKRIAPVDPARWAPEGRPEARGPLLAALTAKSYRLCPSFCPLTLEEFADLIPIWIFCAWFFTLLWLFAGLWDRWTALAASAAFCLLPLSVRLTQMGSFSEPVLGSWLLFLCFCFLLKSALEARWVWSAGAVVAALALALSWRGTADFIRGIEPGWRLYSSLGPLGSLLTAAGFAGVAQAPGDIRRRAGGVFGLLGVLAVPLYANPAWAVGTLLPLMAIGCKVLLEEAPEPAWERLESLFRNAQARISGLIDAVPGRKYLAAGLAVAAGAVVLARSLQRAPEPLIRLTGLESPLKAGERRTLEITLENRGGSPNPDPRAFAGLHVAVENADVEQIDAQDADGGQASTARRPRPLGRYLFFHGPLGLLGTGQSAKASFVIRAYASPVKIYYRGWIPGSCAPRAGHFGYVGPRPKQWRLENCLKRSPLTFEEEKPLCPVPALAPEDNGEPLRCFSAESKP